LHISETSQALDAAVSQFPILAEGGKVARAIDGFEVRAQQQAMAAAVEQAIAQEEILLCEAGTGTGKTLAYLIPALRAGVRVIISTGTRNLQDQLFDKDLPLLRDALGQPVRVVLLKGRANYLCRYRMEQAVGELDLDPVLSKRLQLIKRWSLQTQAGDLAELTALADDEPVLPKVTSTADNCLGPECPAFSECHVVKARRAALDADVVVINHHLYFADMALRDDGFGEILPTARAVIFDEAHQLPEVATRFFGWNISTGQMREVVDDAERAVRGAGGDLAGLRRIAGALRAALAELRGALDVTFKGPQSDSLPWEPFRVAREVAAALDSVKRQLNSLIGALDADGGGEQSNCARRAELLVQRLCKLALAEQDDEVRWVEQRGRVTIWRAAPLNLASLFAAHIESHRAAWIFTSATLAVDGEFGHFAERMGIEDYTAHVWPSPFDYMTQALCYLPEALPEPRGHNHTEALLAETLPLLQASAGGAFLLFTSHRALQFAATWLKSRSDLPLYVQGQAPKAELVRQFVEAGNGVLLGTASFWEGVDVRGDALRLVVIDKLPFAAPDDPVLEARMRTLKEQGREPFRELQLPLAVIALKQGSGRLIRSRKDQGVLVLGDPRLVNRGYGKVFLRSLPTMPITQDRAKACEFLVNRGPVSDV
jgi:ATP-dependent DNA helicase DinG